MSDASENDEELSVYSVRLSSRAATQLRAEHDRLQGLSGPRIADDWEDRLMDTLAGLATLPNRCVIAPEDAVFPLETLCQQLYRRRRGGPAWRILFSIREGTAVDPPMVWVHHIRHSAQAPMNEWDFDRED